MGFSVRLYQRAIGHFGLFGSPRGPISGIFLIPLGVLWIYLSDALTPPEWSKIWVGLLSPLINLALLHSVCRIFRR